MSIGEVDPTIIRRRRKKTRWSDTLAFFLLGLIIEGIVNAVRLFGPSIYKWASDVLGTHPTQLIIGVMVAASGWLAHWFKGRDQRWYGIVEVFFGAASGFAIALSIDSNKPWPPQAATLVGCAYVIERGLNNMRVAKTRLEANTSSAPNP